MKPHPRVSRSGLELVKRFEGLRRKAARLPDGGWTIGYGHTRSAREGAVVDAGQAESLLIYDLDKVSDALDAWCFSPLNQNQADALAAFAFNIGLEAFGPSNVLRRVNEGFYLQAAASLEMWRKADFHGESLVFDALVRRRAAEKALFLTPIDGYRPAPSPVLRPTFDPSVIDAADQRRAAREEPVMATASLDGEVAALELDRPVSFIAEPAGVAEPSPAALAAANLSDRLSRLLARDPPISRIPPEPAPPAAPAPPPLELEPEPLPLSPILEPEPDFQPELDLQPEPEPQPQIETQVESEAPEPEAPPVIAPEPEPEPAVEVDAQLPAIADNDAEAVEPPPPPVIEHPLLSLAAPPLAAVEQAPGAADTDPFVDALFTGPFGRRRTQAAEPEKLMVADGYGTRLLVLGLLGVAMVVGSLLAMLGGRATLMNLAIGLIGVICLAPVAARFLTARLERREAERAHRD